MQNRERVLIGIVGPSCAGKTTLLRHIKEYFSQVGKKINIVQFDDYDKYPSGSEAMDKEMEDPKISNWEDPDLFDLPQYTQDIQALSKGETVTIFNRARENLGNKDEIKTIEPDTITIVEGLFTLYPEGIEDFFDLTFFIDVPENVMVERRLVRTPQNSQDPWDQQEYITTTMLEGTRQYVNPQKDKVDADKILDGTQSSQELAHIIIGYIESLLGNMGK